MCVCVCQCDAVDMEDRHSRALASLPVLPRLPSFTSCSALLCVCVFIRETFLLTVGDEERNINVNTCHKNVKQFFPDLLVFLVSVKSCFSPLTVVQVKENWVRSGFESFIFSFSLFHIRQHRADVCLFLSQMILVFVQFEWRQTLTPAVGGEENREQQMKE